MRALAGGSKVAYGASNYPLYSCWQTRTHASGKYEVLKGVTVMPVFTASVVNVTSLQDVVVDGEISEMSLVMALYYA